MFWVYQTQKNGTLVFPILFWALYSLFYAVCRKHESHLKKSCEKPVLLGRGSGDLRTKKLLTEITEFIESFYSTEQKLSKQD